MHRNLNFVPEVLRPSSVKPQALFNVRHRLSDCSLFSDERILRTGSTNQIPQIRYVIFCSVMLLMNYLLSGDQLVRTNSALSALSINNNNNKNSDYHDQFVALNTRTWVRIQFGTTDPCKSLTGVTLSYCHT